MKCTACSVVALALAAGAASAQPVSPTPLALGTSGPYTAAFTGTPLSNLAWFTFTLTAPTAVDIDINRTVAANDLVASLYRGDITGVDATSYGSYFGFGGLWASSFGPMTFVSTQDDTEDDTLGGPYGDPRFVLNLPAGTYSMVVTSFDSGGFTITSNVPTPAAAALLGLAGLGALRRRR